MRPKIVEMSRRALLPYLLISANAWVFQEESVSDMHNRDNLMEPIQMQLCRKQQSFSDFFATFLKSS